MTSRKRRGRLLRFAVASQSARPRSADELDPALAAALAQWPAPSPSPALDQRLMASAQRLLAQRRRRRFWRVMALAAGLILTLALVDRSFLSAAERIVRESVAYVHRAASNLVGAVGHLKAVDVPLAGRSAFSAEALVPLASPATAIAPRRATAAPRLDARARVALEVRALTLLARGHMLAGTQVEVMPTAAGIAIGGVTDTPEQRQSVLATLGAFVQTPGVTVEIDAATELARTRPRHAAPPQVRIVEIAPDERDVDAEQRAFRNRALTVSREALMHALSLRQLTTRFSAAARRDMSVATQDEWRSLLRGMADLVRRHTHDLRTHVQPVLPGTSDDAAAPAVAAVPPLAVSDDDAMMGVAQEIANEATTVDEQIRGAFARSTRPTTLNGALIERALERLDALAIAAAR